MADYQLTATADVIRTEDGAIIPDDPANNDRLIYEDWITNGGTPDPAPTVTAPSGSEKMVEHRSDAAIAHGLGQRF